MLSVCGKPHLLVIRWVFEIIQREKKKMRIIVMVISVHGFEQTHVHIHPHNASAVLGI